MLRTEYLSFRGLKGQKKEIKSNELNIRGGEWLVYLLGSRNSLGLLPMIAPLPPSWSSSCLQIPLQVTPHYCPPVPNFLAAPSSHPLTPSPLTLWHPVQTAALSANISPPPHNWAAVNAPRTEVLSVIHLCSKPTSFSDSELATPLFLPLSLSVSPGCKIFTAAAAVR